MVVAHREWQNVARGPLEDLRRRAALLGRRLHQLVFEALLEFSLPGSIVGQVFDALYHQLRRPAGELQHEFRLHSEAVAPVSGGRRG